MKAKRLLWNHINSQKNPSTLQVNWELRLSKREAALRIAEEKLFEEQQKLSQERLAINRCEDALSHREHDGQREKEVDTFPSQSKCREMWQILVEVGFLVLLQH